MALVVADRVKETTTTTGTGTVTLAGAVTGFQSFAVVGNANTTYYAIVVEGGSDWEVGIGTYTSSGTTLSRDTVLESSNSNSLVNFGVGTKAVFVTYPADRSVTSDYPNTFTNDQVISVNSSTSALRITQTGAGNALVVEDSANPDSTPFVVNADGRTIIGSTSTAATGVSINPFLQVNATGSGASIGLLKWGNDGTQGYVSFAKSRSATVGTYGTSVQSGDVIGGVLWSGDDGTAPIPAAQIAVAVDGTPGTNDMPGRLVFSTTADGASSPTERMRITNAGNVGIGGTPAGSSQLNVLGTLVSASNLSRGVSSSGTAPTTSTTGITGFFSNPSTADGIGAVSALYHFQAFQGTITGGTRTAPTNQYGVFVDSSLTGATNNYGFYSDIASGTGRWNFYANGTAANYFGGQVQLNQDYIEKRFTANSSTAITLDLANGTMQDITLTASTTITMPTAVAGKSFILFLRSGAGTYTVAWTTVKWPGGTAPTVTATASRLDIYSFFSDGTNWYGITVSQNYTP